MNTKVLKCPNCGASYNPAKRYCDYCGSYIIFSDESDGKARDFDEKVFIADKGAKYKDIFFYTIKLDKDEYPLRVGLANLFRSFQDADGGEMMLTNKRLIFVYPYLSEEKEPPIIYNVNDFVKMEMGLNFYFSAQIKLYNKEGKETIFFVYKRNEWVKRIQGVMNGEFPLKDVREKVAEGQGEINHSEHNASTQANYIQELVELKKLLDAGVITQEDFDLKKRLILKI